MAMTTNGSSRIMHTGINSSPSAGWKKQHAVHHGPQAHDVPQGHKHLVHPEAVISFQIKQLLHEIQIRGLQETE